MAIKLVPNMPILSRVQGSTSPCKNFQSCKKMRQNFKIWGLYLSNQWELEAKILHGLVYRWGTTSCQVSAKSEMTMVLAVFWFHIECPFLPCCLSCLEIQVIFLKRLKCSKKPQRNANLKLIIQKPLCNTSSVLDERKRLKWFAEASGGNRHLRTCENLSICMARNGK